MKKFLIQSVGFVLICTILFYICLSFADGYSDSLYLKFTSPKQNSLILGNSKAAQGLHPDIISKLLGTDPIYNYAFTIMHSPYGPSYFRSIQRKLQPGKNKGIFILQVDPYSISSKLDNPNEVGKFRENKSAVGDIENVSTNPNLKYLLLHYPDQFIFIFKRKLDALGKTYLHNNGWLEVDVSMDSITVGNRISSKEKKYRKRLLEYQFSEIRLEWLFRTIQYLKERGGDVYLVRLPVAQPLYKIENKLMPDFDSKMIEVSQKTGVKYFNYSENYSDYDYTDGNHLYKKSGQKISRMLAEDIKNWVSNGS